RQHLDLRGYTRTSAKRSSQRRQAIAGELGDIKNENSIHTAHPCHCSRWRVRQRRDIESSDGEWTDSAIDRKGRNFMIVLRTFEFYKLEENKPALELLRVTP